LRHGRIEPQSVHARRHGFVTGQERLETGAYFAASKRKTFYPQVIVTFQVDDPKEHYNGPLILGPFGYTIYQGH
jgi:5-hydroxyisourate hydrolase-like protein (transthyretin family)